MKFYSTKLRNGLTVIGEHRPSAVSAAIGFFVKTGARDETPELAGVSHFLEHMMFKGTEKRTALDINYQLGAMGAQANAYTSEEKTVYYAAVLPEYLPDALELFSDMLRSKLDASEFDTEKKVILEEIEMYHDRPTHMLFENALRLYFGTHPAGNSVLGTLDSIRALSRDQMKNYFDSRYSPRNIVLAVSGSFDWNAVTELADKFCGGWTGGTVERAIQPHQPTASEHVIHKANMQRAHVCLIGPGPGSTDTDRFSSQVLSSILGDSSGSRVYWSLIDKGLVDSASIDTEEMDGTGIVVGYASTSLEDLPEVEGTLRSILSAASTFDAGELDRARTKIATRLVLQAESSMRRLMSIGLDWLERNEYLSTEDELSRIKAVNEDSIAKMLSRHDFQPTTTVRLVPQ